MNFRIIKAVLKLFIQIPFYFHSLKRSVQKTEKEKWNLVSTIAKKITKASKISIECIGIENLGKRYMIFANHVGLYDPVAIAAVLNNNTGFVLKNDLQKFKSINSIVNITDSEYIDRDNLKESLKTMNEVYRKLENGKNFVIFPEGTINKNPENLLPFKSGAFRAAMKAKINIVPVVLINTEYGMDKNKKGKLEVKVKILEPLTYEDYKDLKTTAVSNIVQEMIQKEIDKEKAAF